MLGRRRFLQSGLMLGAAPAMPGLAASATHPALPDSAGPWVYWQWMNGNISADGIARDLAAMARMGIVGAYIFDTAVGIPAGPVAYGSETWQALVRHACDEAARLGIAIGLHHAAGYSGTGARWVTPAQSQQRLVWSETRVAGGARPTLPKPFAKLGHYADVAVLAYPAVAGEEAPFASAIDGVVDNRGTRIDPASLRDPGPAERVRLVGDDRGPASITFTLSHPFTARAITVNRFPEEPRNPFDGPRDYPPNFTLEASDDGVRFRAVCRFAAPPLRALEAPAVQAFAPVTARVFRLSSDAPTWITACNLHGGPRLPGWAAKSNAGPAVRPLPATIEVAPPAIDPRTVIDLTDRLRTDGTLDWDASPGRWTVVRLGQTATGEHLAAAPDSATALNIDMFDPAMMDLFFARAIDPLLAVLAPHRGATFQALEIDSFEAGLQNWSTQFPARFAEHAGYPLGAWLLAMTGRIVGDVARTEKALFDIRRVQATIMARNYYGRFRANCARRGLQAHAETYGDGAFDALESAAQVDLAMAEFWAHYTYGSDSRLQLATSAAHARPPSLVAAEAFTGEPRTSAFDVYPAALKAQGDRMATLGVNRLVLHCFVHQPHLTAVPGMTMGPFGSHFDRNLPWAPEAAAWTGYLARCHRQLRQGHPVADIACFKGEEPMGNVPNFRLAPFATPAGYAADIVDAAMLSQLTARARRAVGPGPSYRAIVLPPLPAASLGLMRDLVRLAEAGVPVLVRALPDRAIGGPEDPHADAELRTLSARLARVAIPVPSEDGMAAALLAARIEPAFRVRSAAPDATINFIRHRLPVGEAWFLGNDLRRPDSVVVSLASDMAAATLWWPDRDVREPARLRRTADGRAEIAIDFPPSGAVFVLPAPSPRRPAAGDHDPVLAPARAAAVAAAAIDDFAVMLWAHPDTVMVAGRGFPVPPGEGRTLHGRGHAVAALAVARDGIALYERDIGAARLVLSRTIPLPGWCHLAVRYRGGVPTLFVNGVGVAHGQRSANHVHPGLGQPPVYSDHIIRFQGEATSPEMLAGPVPDAMIAACFARGLPPPALLPRYAFPGARPDLMADPPECRVVDEDWRVTFHAGIAPLHLARLASLHLHPDPAVCHYAGRATWTRSVDIAAPAHGRRIWLDLGRLCVTATVAINGRTLGALWTPPFALDITDAIQPGANVIAVTVAMIWPNRLIGDEACPAEARYGPAGQIEVLPDWFTQGRCKTGVRSMFATWRHFDADDPLRATGLLGPVCLYERAAIAT